MRALVALLLVSLSNASPAVAQSIPLTPGIHPSVTFTQYPALATAQSIASRYLSPVTAEAIRRKIGASGKTLQSSMFDIKSESYAIYVPRNRPPAGYGLLIFVSPSSSAEIPNGWPDILDRFGMIFVSAARSGNDERVIERRVPLALAALKNIQELFPIDPEHTVIGGLSGGARVAMRIALAYPDLFSGALLNAGSDPIGEPSTPLPAPALLQQFQSHSRLAYLTGDADTGGLALDSASIASMKHWCVGQVSVRNDHGVGHEIARPQALAWALGALSASKPQPSEELSRCRAARQQETDSAIARISSALSEGRKESARAMILKSDAVYGGLVAVRSISMADECACGIFDHKPGRTGP
jgi:predicted esterase